MLRDLGAADSGGIRSGRRHAVCRHGVFTIAVTVDDGHGGADVLTTTAVVQGVGLVDGTLYFIGTAGRDDVKLQFNEKKDELKVDVKLNQHGSGGCDKCRQPSPRRKVHTSLLRWPTSDA